MESVTSTEYSVLWFLNTDLIISSIDGWKSRPVRVTHQSLDLLSVSQQNTRKTFPSLSAEYLLSVVISGVCPEAQLVPGKTLTLQ